MSGMVGRLPALVHGIHGITRRAEVLLPLQHRLHHRSGLVGSHSGPDLLTTWLVDLIGHVSLFASRTNHCFFADDARASLIVNLCTEVRRRYFGTTVTNRLNNARQILLWGSFAFSVATACLGARLSGRMTPKEYCCYLVRIHNHPEHDVTIVPVLLCILVAIYLVYMSTMFVVAYESPHEFYVYGNERR